MFTNFYGQTKEQYLLCKELIDEDNRKAIVLVSGISLIFYSSLVVVSLYYFEILKYRLIYILAIVLILIFLYVSKHCKPLRRNIILQVYVVIGIMLMIAMMLSLATPDQKGTSFPVLLVLIPLLFLDNQLRMMLFLVAFSGGYCALVLKYKLPVEAYYDIFSACRYLVVSLLAHYFINVKSLKSIVGEWRMKQKIVSYETLQGKLVKKAENDALTGVYNRESFMNYANARLKLAQEAKATMVLGILDLDHFKQINDSFGHQIGDFALREVALALTQTLRSDDMVGRLGGDEFIFLLDGVKDGTTLECIVRRILACINEIEIVDDHYIHASIGITFLQEKDQRFSELYKRADMALYRAKEKGRNCYCECE